MSEIPRGEQPENQNKLEQSEPVLDKKQEEQGRSNVPDWLKRDIERREAKQRAEARGELERKFGEREISPELARDLREAAKISNAPENLAMMTPELRKILQDVRRNHRIYFFGHGRSDEGGPAKISEYQITTNEIGLKRPEAYNRINGLFTGEYDYIYGKDKSGVSNMVNKKPSWDNELPVEVVAIDPIDNENYAVIYKYSSVHMLDSNNTRPQTDMRIGLGLPRVEAKQLFSLMKAHPEFCREFFVCAARDTKGEFVKIILEGSQYQPGRRVDWEKTDIKRKILFCEHDGKSYSLSEMSPQGGNWKDVTSGETKRKQDYMNQEAQEWRELRERQKTKKKPGFLKKVWDFLTENYEE